jgi:hypothetical protein
MIDRLKGAFVACAALSALAGGKRDHRGSHGRGPPEVWARC